MRIRLKTFPLSAIAYLLVCGVFGSSATAIPTVSGKLVNVPPKASILTKFAEFRRHPRHRNFRGRNRKHGLKRRGRHGEHKRRRGRRPLYHHGYGYYHGGYGTYYYRPTCRYLAGCPCRFLSGC